MSEKSQKQRHWIWKLVHIITRRADAQKNFEHRLKDNVRGKYYVDYQCLDCDLCRETSPNNFKRNDERGESYIYKQPETPEEIELCNEAIEGCCVKAIRDDGDRFDWDTIPPYDWDANGTLAEEPKKEGCCCNKKTPPENPAPST